MPSESGAGGVAGGGWIVWAGLCAASGAVVGLLCLPPLTRGTPLEPIGEVARAAYAPFCHQNPERSFALGGVPLLACSRCTAIYAGGLLGLLGAAVIGRVGKVAAPPASVLAAVVVPLGVDGLGGMLGLWGSPVVVRVAVALPTGAVLALFVLAGCTALAAEPKRRPSVLGAPTTMRRPEVTG